MRIIAIWVSIIVVRGVARADSDAPQGEPAPSMRRFELGPEVGFEEKGRADEPQTVSYLVVGLAAEAARRARGPLWLYAGLGIGRLTDGPAIFPGDVPHHGTYVAVRGGAEVLTCTRPLRPVLRPTEPYRLCFVGDADVEVKYRWLDSVDCVDAACTMTDPPTRGDGLFSVRAGIGFAGRTDRLYAAVKLYASSGLDAHGRSWRRADGVLGAITFGGFL